MLNRFKDCWLSVDRFLLILLSNLFSCGNDLFPPISGSPLRFAPTVVIALAAGESLTLAPSWARAPALAVLMAAFFALAVDFFDVCC